MLSVELKSFFSYTSYTFLFFSFRLFSILFFILTVFFETIHFAVQNKLYDSYVCAWVCVDALYVCEWYFFSVSNSSIRSHFFFPSFCESFVQVFFFFFVVIVIIYFHLLSLHGIEKSHSKIPTHTHTQSGRSGRKKSEILDPSYTWNTIFVHQTHIQKYRYVHNLKWRKKEMKIVWNQVSYVFVLNLKKKSSFDWSLKWFFERKNERKKWREKEIKREKTMPVSIWIHRCWFGKISVIRIRIFMDSDNISNRIFFFFFSFETSRFDCLVLYCGWTNL